MEADRSLLKSIYLFIKKEGKGFLIALLLSIFATVLSKYTPKWLNSILLALLGGILVANLIKIPKSFMSGISFTSGKMLELSVIFLAFNINFSHIANIGIQTFIAISVILVLVLLFTIYYAKKTNYTDTSGWLIGFGTAICGSSAIAALAPAVSKNNEDVGIAMAVVNLFGTIGMLTLPLILFQLQCDPDKIGVLLGGALHSVGNVAGSAYALNDQVGEIAITTKLARVALLSPGLIFFTYLISKQDNSGSQKFSWSLPWYLWGFITITVVGSFYSYPDSFVNMMEEIGKYILTIAMAAIGMKISFPVLISSAKKGLLFGLLIFAFQVIMYIIFLKYIL
ncbi:MAG: putative sulfate exporter family transporter [Saprospiraceae bacterium]